MNAATEDTKPVSTGHSPLAAGQLIAGFKVQAITPVKEARLLACQCEHIKSGARVIHLINEDDENLFSIAIPTPPPDDTGVPHILEHSVLSGSQKYPVRDPFFEMIKMSMATFINAMTGPDCTYYPVSSNVKRDLFNLADVYFDAVFHPILSEKTFQREGHHFAPLQAGNPTGELTANGIVFNEMKGVFSNPEQKIQYSMSNGLFPDTVLGHCSGGAPDSILTLTYEAFKQYHRSLYHPSRAHFLLYGNIPTREYLEFLDDRLIPFQRLSVSPPVVDRQPRWSVARKIEDTYPIGQDETPSSKTYIVMNWLAGDALDPMDIAALDIIALVLLGNEAAPVRKALVDSKLGQDTFCPGLQTNGPELMFGLGLKGTEPERAADFVSLVHRVLKSCVDHGIDNEQIETAFQQAAYQRLEIHSGYPLHIMDSVLSSWIYDRDPLLFLHMKSHMEKCREKYKSDPGFFTRLIKERFLDNPHNILVVLKPDRGWQVRVEAGFSTRMKHERERITDKQAQAIASDAMDLERISGTPNSPEALATLPQLKIADLPAKPKDIPTSVESLGGGTSLIRTDVFSNSVNYIDINFDLTGLPADLWPYLNYYADAIHKLGAAGMNFEQISRRVAAHTGGIGCWPCFHTHCSDATRSILGLRFTIKALDGQMESALEVFRDLLFGLDPHDKARLRDVLKQALTNCRTDLLFDAGTADSHAARGFTQEAFLGELVGGLPQLALLRRYNADFDTLSDHLMTRIDALRENLLVRNRVTVAFTGSDGAAGIVRSSLKDWLTRMPSMPLKAAPTGFIRFNTPRMEGLAAPIQIAHCSQVMPAPHYSSDDSVFLSLGAHIVNMDYMLNEIRFKGNAYGASFRYDSLGGLLHLGSFRDPHVNRTLKVFSSVTDYVRNADWTQTDIDRAIIGVARGDERPIRPEQATRLVMQRHLSGQTLQLRETRHARLLHSRPADVKQALLGMLDQGTSRASTCVMANRQKLEKANLKLRDGQLAIEEIEPDSQSEALAR